MKWKRVRWDPSISAAENARRRLPALAERYFSAGRKLVDDGKASDADLHALRLATKRFRYTLELFQGCYGPGMNERLAALRRIQQLLGDLNDVATTSAMLEEVPHPAAAKAWLNHRSKKLRREFRNYWRRSFDAEGREKWWRDYLTRFAKRPAGTLRPGRRVNEAPARMPVPHPVAQGHRSPGKGNSGGVIHSRTRWAQR
jgi:CHAD domain-containing protein